MKNIWGPDGSFLGTFGKGGPGFIMPGEGLIGCLAVILGIPTFIWMIYFWVTEFIKQGMIETTTGFFSVVLYVFFWVFPIGWILVALILLRTGFWLRKLDKERGQPPYLAIIIVLCLLVAFVAIISSAGSSAAKIIAPNPAVTPAPTPIANSAPTGSDENDKTPAGQFGWWKGKKDTEVVSITTDQAEVIVQAYIQKYLPGWYRSDEPVKVVEEGGKTLYYLTIFGTNGARNAGGWVDVDAVPTGNLCIPARVSRQRINEFFSTDPKETLGWL